VIADAAERLAQRGDQLGGAGRLLERGQDRGTRGAQQPVERGTLPRPAGLRLARVLPPTVPRTTYRSVFAAREFRVLFAAILYKSALQEAINRRELTPATPN
jgi:hypothetical protein